jgi:hypothetical protein
MKMTIKVAAMILAMTLLATPFIVAHAAGQKGHGPARFPNLQAAKRLLNNARGKLEAAPSEFGGHRAAALKLVNEALVEVNQAIDYGMAHPENPAPAAASGAAK